MLAISTAFPTLSIAQSELEQRWVNIASSPLEIRFTPSKRDGLLVNRSSGRVVQYRLGCVVNDSDLRIRVLKKLKPVRTQLETGKALINSVSVHQLDMERCEKAASRLAVIEVIFQDGFAWRAN